MPDKKATKFYVINDMGGSIPVKPGTECTIISETIDEARISFTEWPKGEQSVVVLKHTLSPVMPELNIYSDEPTEVVI